MKGFLSKRISMKVDVLQNQKKYCLQTCLCIFQPGNFTAGEMKGLVDIVVSRVGEKRVCEREVARQPSPNFPDQ